MRSRASGSPIRFIAGPILAVVMVSGSACTTSAKKDTAKTALNAMSAAQRKEMYEATMRMLDEHPELVDEIYSIVRNHRPLLERFTADTVTDLADRPMAELAAKQLVENPPAVEQTTITTLEFIAQKGPARAAMNRAVAARAEVAADIVTDSPAAVGRALEAGLVILDRKPAAREATLLAVRKNRRQVLAFLKNEPELTKDIAREVLREAVKDKPALEKALRSVKILGDEEEPRR